MRAGRVASSLALIVLTSAPIAIALSSPVDGWILEKIESDENLLREAILRENGRDIRLLEESTTYVLFFSEPPDFGAEMPEYDSNLVCEFFVQQVPTLFAGGYIFRISFRNASALYALSAGEWKGQEWFNPTLNRELEIDPLRVWAGSEGADFSYATILSGVPPRLVVFSEGGDVKDERVFDLSDPNLAGKIQEVENLYSRSGEPSLEMVSVAEYLRENNPLWRKVDITSSFNFRNQHQRPEETPRIKEIEELTRDEAKRELRLRLGESEVPGVRPDREVEIETGHEPDPVEGVKPIQSEPTIQNEGNEGGKWPLIIGAIVALCVVVTFVRSVLLGRAS